MFSETDGYGVELKVLKSHAVIDLRSTTGIIAQDAGRKAAGARNLLANSEIQKLAITSPILDLARNILGPNARVVKATYFDKTDSSNWKVPAHQDVTITVQKKVETPGFGPWTEKSGVTNVQPPNNVLAAMVALRVHLDDADEFNGALRVWPGSHLHGKIRDNGIQQWVENHSAVTCAVTAGDVMLMRPLLIHASSAAVAPTHRRVIHFEYTSSDLPNGLKWLGDL